MLYPKRPADTCTPLTERTTAPRAPGGFPGHVETMRQAQQRIVTPPRPAGNLLQRTAPHAGSPTPTPQINPRGRKPNW